MNQFRPPHFWNFFEDNENPNDNVKHVLRYDANPTAAYSDERIEPILKNIEAIGLNLKGYEDIKWKQMLDHSFDIF